MVIPGLRPRSRASWPDSSLVSRLSSLDRLGLTMSATGRSTFGKAFAGAPGGARWGRSFVDAGDATATTNITDAAMTTHARLLIGTSRCCQVQAAAYKLTLKNGHYWCVSCDGA